MRVFRDDLVAGISPSSRTGTPVRTITGICTSVQVLQYVFVLRRAPVLVLVLVLVFVIVLELVVVRLYQY